MSKNPDINVAVLKAMTKVPVPCLSAMNEGQGRRTISTKRYREVAIIGGVSLGMSWKVPKTMHTAKGKSQVM